MPESLKDPTVDTELPAGAVRGPDGLVRPAWAVASPQLMDYYDSEWGMPVHEESALLERLCLEGFQSGLSWAVVLRKREAFRRAFAGFDADEVAAFDDGDVERLTADASIIRNERKIRATIANARATVALRDKGGLDDFLWSFMPEDNLYPATPADIPKFIPEALDMSAALKKEGFRFVGPVTCFSLMEAIGMVDAHLLSSHRRGCSGLW